MVNCAEARIENCPRRFFGARSGTIASTTSAADQPDFLADDFSVDSIAAGAAAAYEEALG